MDTKVIALQEGSFTVGRDKSFVPFDLGNDDLNERSRGSLLVEVQPFLVRNRDRNIIFDTGLGFENDEQVPMIIANLSANGVRPEDVDYIMMSHLHKDHSGGLVHLELFENAKIYIYQPEFEFALAQGAPSYVIDNLNSLIYNDKVVWLTGEEGVVLDNIRYFKTGGHCPEHIAFEIMEDGYAVFYGGDELPQYKQLKVKYVAKYDYDGEKAMQLRKDWLEEGTEKKWKILFYHDIQKPFVQL